MAALARTGFGISFLLDRRADGFKDVGVKAEIFPVKHGGEGKIQLPAEELSFGFLGECLVRNEQYQKGRAATSAHVLRTWGKRKRQQKCRRGL